MQTLLLLVAGLALSGSVSVWQQYDLTGEWTFTVQTDQGGGSPTMIFKQDGDKLTGKYKGQFGEADISGTVAGATFRFSFSGDAQGTAFTVTYDGQVENADSVKGKVDLAGMATGTFTGTRRK